MNHSLQWLILKRHINQTSDGQQLDLLHVVEEVYDICGKPFAISNKIKHIPTLSNHSILGIYSKDIKAQNYIYKMFITVYSLQQKYGNLPVSIN